MKNVKLKICGMREHQNILDVAALNPDYMGFIFFSKSPRNVGHEFSMPEGFPAEVKKVGVFVNEDTETILSLSKRLKLDFIQLHGKESVKECETLKDHGLGVIKVFSVDDDFNFNVTSPYKKIVDYFLFDTKGKFYGGNAQTFNWNILNRYNQEVSFFLSGGLNPENIEDIAKLQSMNTHALDINSGVESAPGVKDIEKVKALMKKLGSNI